MSKIPAASSNTLLGRAWSLLKPLTSPILATLGLQGGEGLDPNGTQRGNENPFAPPPP